MTSSDESAPTIAREEGCEEGWESADYEAEEEAVKADRGMQGM